MAEKMKKIIIILSLALILAIAMAFATMIAMGSVLAGGVMFFIIAILGSATGTLSWWIPATTLLTAIFAIYVLKWV